MSEGAADGTTQLCISLRGLSVAITQDRDPRGRPTVAVSILDDPLRGPTAGGAGSPAAAPVEEPDRPSASSLLHRPVPEESEVVSRLQGQLGPLGGLSSEERIRRAFQAGLGDSRVVAGDERFPAAVPALRGRASCCYVVLCGLPGAPFWVARREEYFSLAPFRPGVVSRAFPSEAEGEAYCQGSGLDGLPSRR